MNDQDYMDWSCGKFSWICCIPPALIRNAIDFFKNHSDSDIVAIYDACVCQTANAVANGGTTPAGGGTQPTPGTTPAGGGGSAPSLASLFAGVQLASNCGDARDFLCRDTIKSIVAAIMVILNNLDVSKSSKVVQGVVALLKFLGNLYQLACTDDSTAAIFILSLCALDEYIVKSAFTFPTDSMGMFTLSALVTDLLQRVESLSAQSTCCANMLSTYRNQANVIQTLIASGFGS